MLSLAFIRQGPMMRTQPEVTTSSKSICDWTWSRLLQYCYSIFFHYLNYVGYCVYFKPKFIKTILNCSPELGHVGTNKFYLEITHCIQKLYQDEGSSNHMYPPPSTHTPLSPPPPPTTTTTNTQNNKGTASIPGRTLSLDRYIYTLYKLFQRRRRRRRKKKSL